MGNVYNRGRMKASTEAISDSNEHAYLFATLSRIKAPVGFQVFIQKVSKTVSQKRSHYPASCGKNRPTHRESNGTVNFGIWDVSLNHAHPLLGLA